MSARIKKASGIVGLAALCFVIDFFFIGLTGAPIGAVQAPFDRALGDLRIKAYGLQHPVFHDYQKLMSERYRINIDFIAGRTPNQWQISYVEAYNAISKAAIEKKYGGDSSTKASQRPHKL